MDNELSQFNRDRSFRRTDAVFFVAAFLFMYAQLFQFPLTPIYFDGDHMISVSNALRLLDGEVIYRDFFHLTPPGTELIYAGLFSIFGVRIWVLNAVILALGMIQAWLIWYFSRRVLSGMLTYLPAALLLVAGFRGFFIDGSYRLFSVIAVLGAVAVIFENRTAKRLVIAGVLCGIGSFFVQTRGVVGIAGIGLFLVWANYKNGWNPGRLISDSAYLVGPFIMTVAITHGITAWVTGLETYYFSMVTFPRVYYPNDPLSNATAYFSDVPPLRGLLDVYSPAMAVSRFVRILIPTAFIYVLIPLVYIVFLFVRRRLNRASILVSVDERLMLLSFVGLLLAVGTSAPSGIRFYQVGIPGFVILVFLLSQVRSFVRLAPHVLAIVAICGLAFILQRQFVGKYPLDMPGGRAYFLSQIGYYKFKLVGDITIPGEPFYEAFHPTFYFALHLKNPAPLYLIRDSNYTPKFQADAVLQALEKTPPEIILWHGNYSKRAEERMPGDNLEGIWQFVQKNYMRELEFPEVGNYTFNSYRDSEVWRLRKDR